MMNLEVLKNRKQSLERQIENSRNADLDLIEEYDEIEIQIKYLIERAEFTDEEIEDIPFLLKGV
jgi:chromosome segregation ATPase